MGYKLVLMEEIENVYVNIGVMYVLAVFGLYVGLVQFIFMWLLGCVLLRQFLWKIVKIGLIIVGIWAFVFLIGVVFFVFCVFIMFSFLVVGFVLQWIINVYNIFVALVFVLLVINFNLLYYVGFQLFYLVVLGIVYFQFCIYSFWYIENWIGDYFWQLFVVFLVV